MNNHGKSGVSAHMNALYAMPKNKETTLYLRISEPTDKRVADAMARLRLERPDVLRLVLDAGLEALEKADYRVMLPLRFQMVTDVDLPDSRAALNEQPPQRAHRR